VNCILNFRWKIKASEPSKSQCVWTKWVYWICSER